jgi:polynucleotide 5'-kinase involved in rRNA processing
MILENPSYKHCKLEFGALIYNDDKTASAQHIQKALETMPVVVLLGPRQAGKTTLALDSC